MRGTQRDVLNGLGSSQLERKMSQLHLRTRGCTVCTTSLNEEGGFPVPNTIVLDGLGNSLKIVSPAQHAKLRHFGFPPKRVKTARLAKFSHLQSGSSRSVQGRCTPKKQIKGRKWHRQSGSTSRRTRHVACEVAQLPLGLLPLWKWEKASLIWHG